MTTADYLTQLVKDVETVRTNLNAQGVITEPTETLTTLAPKINSISAEIATVTYMRLYDLEITCDTGATVPEYCYNKHYVDKVDALLNELGGE